MAPFVKSNVSCAAVQDSSTSAVLYNLRACTVTRSICSICVPATNTCRLARAALRRCKVTWRVRVACALDTNFVVKHELSILEKGTAPWRLQHKITENILPDARMLMVVASCLRPDPAAVHNALRPLKLLD